MAKSPCKCGSGAEIYIDNQIIREDFNDLYAAMNGKTLREMDQIIYPVCTLCRDHEKTGFQEGVKVGIRLAQEANIA